MIIKLFKTFSISSLLVLAACGGGGGGDGGATSSQPTLNAVVLSTLSNSQGISRITDSGTVGLIYSPQIASVTQSMNQAAQNGGSSAIANVNPTNFPVISTTPSTVTRRGTITSEGVTLNVTALKNNATSNAGGIYFEIPGDADILMVIGDSVSSMPSSGTSTYTGAFTQNARSVIAPGSIGTFSMVVNFSSRTFTINGSTSTTSLNGAGTIDITSGLFASSNISFSVNGFSYTANLYGNLHGAGSTSASGIFYTNDTSPDYSGSFIGSR